MKVLIWFLCLLVSSLITVFLSYAGVFLGGIPTVLLYVLAFWLARTFCKAWDNHKAQKQALNTPTTSIRVCKTCNRNLPDGTEICQYCGTKIETDITSPSPTADDIETSITPQDATPANSIHDFNSLSPEDSLNKLLEIQVCETLSAAEENFHHQPCNENDPDFGLVPEKPIYTLALKSVAGEHEYLDKLYAATGEKITYTRLGSTSADGVNGITDIYNTYLPSGQHYKTVYINMYGATTSTAPPAGFTFQPPLSSPDPQQPVKHSKKQYCSGCGAIIDKQTKKCTGCGKQYFKGIRINKYIVIIILLALIIIGSLCVNIYQFNNTAILQKNLNASQSEVDSLNSKLHTYQVAVDELRDDIDDLNIRINALKAKQAEILEYLYFYKDHAQIVPNDGTNLYHTIDCPYLDTSYFWIYNTESAIQRGYKECPHCH